MANTITYSGRSGEHHLPIGDCVGVVREGACEDICLVRSVAWDCPLRVRILIRTSGEIVLWSARWEDHDPNPYWHFAALSPQSAARTNAQITALETMWLGLAVLPGNLSGSLGQQVAVWAFAGSTPDEIAARHGVPTPILVSHP